MAGMFTVGQSSPAPAIANPYATNTQKFGDSAQSAYQNYFGGLSQPFQYRNLPSLPGAYDFSADRQRMEDAVYGKAAGTLDQRYKTETDAFNQQMANQGVDIGSERYRREKALFDQSRNEAYNDARYRAILAGGDEQSRLFGLGLQSRQQSVAEQSSERQQQNADLAALLDPYYQSGQLSNQLDIANQQNATNIYGINTDKQIADQQSLDTRYGVDQETARSLADRVSRENLAKLSDDTSRYGIDRNAEVSLADRISRENLARMQDETNRAGYASQEGIARSNNEFERIRQELQNSFTADQNQRDRKLTKGENAKNRSLQAGLARRSGGGGGGGGGGTLPQSVIDAAAAAGLI